MMDFNKNYTEALEARIQELELTLNAALAGWEILAACELLGTPEYQKQLAEITELQQVLTVRK